MRGLPLIGAAVATAVLTTGVLAEPRGASPRAPRLPSPYLCERLVRQLPDLLSRPLAAGPCRPVELRLGAHLS